MFNLAGRRFTISQDIETGSRYQFKIKAYNGVLIGDESPISEVMIAALVPSKPLNLQKLSTTKNSVTIEWQVPDTDGGAYITSYSVYSDSGAGADFTYVGSTDGLAFTHSNLQPSGMLIAYKLKAVNDVGESELTDSCSVIVAVLPGTPDAPELVTTDLTSIEIQW